MINEHGIEGLTLRDYFAALALQGILAQPLRVNEKWDHGMCADSAYKFADAMLQARVSCC